MLADVLEVFERRRFLAVVIDDQDFEIAVAGFVQDAGDTVFGQPPHVACRNDEGDKRRFVPQRRLDPDMAKVSYLDRCTVVRHAA